MNLNQMTHLQQRLIVGGLALVAVIFSIAFSQSPLGKIVFDLLLAGVTALSIWELFHMSDAAGFKPLKCLGIITGVATLLTAAFIGDTPSFWPIIAAIGFFLMLSSFLVFFKRGDQPLTNISITMFSFVYLAIPLSCMVLISSHFPSTGVQDNRWWLCYLLGVTKMTDICAYFCGKYFGKTKFTPYISPKKTWEGAIGGFLFSMTTSVVFFLAIRRFNLPMDLSLTQSIWLGALISVLAQLGDLAESLVKRDTRIKDSNSLPGLGGMLDAVDSFIFTAPVLYMFLKINY